MKLYTYQPAQCSVHKKLLINCCCCNTSLVETAIIKGRKGTFLLQMAIQFLVSAQNSLKLIDGVFIKEGFYIHWFGLFSFDSLSISWFFYLTTFKNKSGVKKLGWVDLWYQVWLKPQGQRATEFLIFSEPSFLPVLHGLASANI